jgi:YD repeat-containing protein
MRRGPDPERGARPRPDHHRHPYNDHGLVRRADRRIPREGRAGRRAVCPSIEVADPQLGQAALRRPGAAGPPVDVLRRRLRVRDVHDLQRHQYVRESGRLDRPRTRTYTDALGRVTSIRHYSKDDSSSDDGRVTAYEYDARGNRSKVTDPAGNAWTYTYDARGRVTSTTDPDVGRTDTGYDDADRPNKVTDAKSRTTHTEYDELGRIKYIREGSATATPPSRSPTTRCRARSASPSPRSGTPRAATTSTVSPATTPTTGPRAARR